jgi:hypothetical protein
MARQAVEDLDIRVLPYTADHAFHLFDLPLHHSDPFDRHLENGNSGVLLQSLLRSFKFLPAQEKQLFLDYALQKAS